MLTKPLNPVNELLCHHDIEYIEDIFHILTKSLKIDLMNSKSQK